MRFNELVRFRLFEMPCCGVAICWVNQRLPNFCPECGKRVYGELKTNGAIIDTEAFLKESPRQSKPDQPR